MQQRIYYWSVLLFEEVCFKDSFAGREGRTQTNSERKRIPDLCTREAEGTIAMLFFCFLFVCFLKVEM